MSIILDLQQTIPSSIFVPEQEKIKLWLNNIAEKKSLEAELSVRIVDDLEIITLNKIYRKKNAVTNILSFPCDVPAEVELPVRLLGDIIICATKVNDEALEQKKSPEYHWAHIVTHGVLHLLGYDHQTDEDASIMETLEIELLENLGINNPYEKE